MKIFLYIVSQGIEQFSSKTLFQKKSDRLSIKRNLWMSNVTLMLLIFLTFSFCMSELWFLKSFKNLNFAIIVPFMTFHLHNEAHLCLLPIMSFEGHMQEWFAKITRRTFKWKTLCLLRTLNHFHLNSCSHIIYSLCLRKSMLCWVGYKLSLSLQKLWQRENSMCWMMMWGFCFSKD